MNKLQDYTLLTAFVSGAFSANSGGSVTEGTFTHATPEEMKQAEEELRAYGDIVDAYRLGHKADEGYTMFLPVEADESERPMLAFEILNRYY
jgi:hypothetical protein